MDGNQNAQEAVEFCRVLQKVRTVSRIVRRQRRQLSGATLVQSFDIAGGAHERHGERNLQIEGYVMRHAAKCETVNDREDSNDIRALILDLAQIRLQSFF
ncbi:hypothetical protein [Bradyrhizobium sp. Ghvi]|uniref:hypothetical protein n=1 Tax=Bradyrhizobium sp. Ghvi TaxID=1855319 RepID=UPI0011784339|nr:hypothetical protein [Bradyrhizobium sp. Ghvi]